MCDEPSAEDVEAAERLLQREAEQHAEAITLLYGSLPEWLPPPQWLRLQQSLAVMFNADQRPHRLVTLVQANDCQIPDNFQFPGTARDPIAFIQALDFLKHLKRVLQLDEAAAMKELAGEDAATGHHVRKQLRNRSKTGNEQKKIRAAEKRARWFEFGQPLRRRHPEATDTDLAGWIHDKTGDPIDTIRRALPELGLSRNNK